MIDAFDMSRGPASATRTRLVERPEGEFWESQASNAMFEVADDGRFIMLFNGQGDVAGDLIMVRNFFEELRRLVPR